MLLPRLLYFSPWRSTKTHEGEEGVSIPLLPLALGDGTRQNITAPNVSAPTVTANKIRMIFHENRTHLS